MNNQEKSRGELHNQELKIIGNRIRELRKAHKLTQAAFAKKIRRDYSTVSKLEAGKLELSSLMRLAIMNTFGVREEWLLTGKEPIYDDRKKLLEERAKELGADIFNWFLLMKAAYSLRQEAIEATLEDKLRVLSYDELSDPELFKIIKQLERIYNEGDRTKIEGVKGMLKALDPGEKKQDRDAAKDAGTESKSNTG